MISHPPTSALIEFIKNNYLEYYGKICELRGEIEQWLSYIPHTFPHYTRHTIRHSDTIVFQISNLLFKDDESLQPIVKLSGIEAYILVAAAYLHDAGMVTSDKEKAEILNSDSWNKWTTSEGGGAKRWNDIQVLRENTKSETTNPTTLNFLADVQTRFLIAEFIRSQHHLRAANVIELHHDKLGRIDFDDHMLREAIAQVCVSHGLGHHELEDNERFPDLRHIRDEKVNLRFLSILLRLGDLLDMSVDRACPILLNAASPLPPDSLAHWEQYKAIRHRATSPESIDVIAECSNQEEDRVLRDWCQWIVDEVRNAKIVMQKARRHNDWRVPDATIEGDSPSIKIRPAQNANYIPTKWMLDFDKQAVFNLLSEDLYKNPMVFVRELIQNALDALRCKMYADLEREGKEIPVYPTQVPENIRERYSVQLNISNKEIFNKLSGEMETKQVLVIEDNGIGMDADIIEKYFLQVGRSFYKSDEFRRKFRFTPTSSFGIGFLSVFAASDNVIVDTFKPSSELPKNAPVQITLTGLRNYLLREKSGREKAGTRIEIVLRDDIKHGHLTELVLDWCKRVEFSIFVNDFGKNTPVVAERPEDFIYEHHFITIPNAKYVLRSFPVNRLGIEGELYILAYIDEQGESWVGAPEIEIHPLTERPKEIESVECLHGIVTRIGINYGGSFISRIDFRNSKFSPTLARNEVRSIGNNTSKLIPEIESRWEEVLSEHLAKSPHAQLDNSWQYKQFLAFKFPLLNFWTFVPKTIRIYYKGVYGIVSLDELLSFEEISVVIKASTKLNHPPDENMEKVFSDLDIIIPAIDVSDLSKFPDIFKDRIFINKTVKSIQWLQNRYIGINWIKIKKDNNQFHETEEENYILVDFANSDLISLQSNPTKSHGTGVLLLNSNHVFVQWMKRVKVACFQSKYNLNERQFNELLHLVKRCSTFNDDSLLSQVFKELLGGDKTQEMLENYIQSWKEISNLPSDLYPPAIKLTGEMFGNRRLE